MLVCMKTVYSGQGRAGQGGLGWVTSAAVMRLRPKNIGLHLLGSHSGSLGANCEGEGDNDGNGNGNGQVQP